tara:strand:- start:372 stop:593 length:222 start_codon:yes stop_codon:yes gene_type:complete
MEKEDIKMFLKLHYWPVVQPVKNNKWQTLIYKKEKGEWNINKKRIFISPYKAYEWANEYLSNIYYAEKKPYSA